jgi:hypothetical protein
MSGVGSPEPPGIRMNNFILCPMIIVFRMNNRSSFVQWSLETKVQVQKALWSYCKPSHQQRWSLFDDHVQQDRRPGSKIDDLRARSMCVCVILHISSWRYGRIVTLFWCINDDYNLCVCDFAYLVMKIWPHCNLVLMY